MILADDPPADPAQDPPGEPETDGAAPSDPAAPSANTDLDLLQPAGSEVSDVCRAGHPSRRLVVILRAPGCSYALRTGGCTNCGFHHLTTRGRRVPTRALLTQLERAITRHAAELSSIEELDLYCSGSFFNEEELQADAQAALLARCVRLPALRTVLVDSRPELISDEALARARASLGRLDLEVAIGLESADDEIRERLIRKGFSRRSFEEAVRRIARAGAGLVVYLLLKPLGTTEEQAVSDVQRSGRYLRELGQRLGLPTRVALEPVFVAEGTPLHDELLAGRYSPPSLWSVVRAALALQELLPVHVGLSSEDLPVPAIPRGCDACDGKLRQALAVFNQTQDPRPLRRLSCYCRA